MQHFIDSIFLFHYIFVKYAVCFLDFFFPYELFCTLFTVFDESALYNRVSTFFYTKYLGVSLHESHKKYLNLYCVLIINVIKHDNGPPIIKVPRLFFFFDGPNTSEITASIRYTHVLTSLQICMQYLCIIEA